MKPYTNLKQGSMRKGGVNSPPKSPRPPVPAPQPKKEDNKL